MISLIDGEGEQVYTYDRRGNLTAVSKGEELLKAFTFDAANRMTEALRIKDGVEKRAEYSYDAFGNRIGQDIYSRKAGSGVQDTGRREPKDPERQIRYTLDLTRQYHNLLVSEGSAGQKEQVFYWDGNVAAMEEAGHDSYYLQDDLGSPMLLADEEGEIRESYAFDEFGQSFYHSPESQLQPFGYTGYQMEEAGGLYFAQARRYDAGAGRFVSEDKVKGNAYLPVTINAYLYCRNQPLKYVDPSGNDCYYFYLPEWENEAKNDRRQLAEAYGLDYSQVHLVEVTDNQSLTDAWNAMGIENGNIVQIDAVVINTHGNEENLAYKRSGGESFTGIKIQALEDKNMGVLILYGCNAGHADYVGTNPASVFSQKVNGAPVLASDGTVYSGWIIFNWTDRNYDSRADDTFKDIVLKGMGIERDNDGWMIYQYADGNVSVSQSLGKTMSISVMLEKIEDYVCDIA